ncbi:MAG: hypothetical protein HUU50_15805, partial [Candidatus Brocadiae bacterium]|nr:hypothetical protein [Candidatus Brocadiia bacterium]
MKRFYQISITFLSWAFFLSISYKNIQGAKVEIMLLGLVMALGILFTAFSGVLFSWTAKQNFILACVLFILFAAKHFLTSYTSSVASFYYFAIVPFIFCMGEVFLIFAIWDLYQKNSTKFRTIFYNGMVLVTSSYSCQTMLLL